MKIIKNTDILKYHKIHDMDLQIIIFIPRNVHLLFLHVNAYIKLDACARKYVHTYAEQTWHLKNPVSRILNLKKRHQEQRGRPEYTRQILHI